MNEAEMNVVEYDFSTSLDEEVCCVTTDEIRISRSFPNPFSGRATFIIETREPGRLSVEIFNTRGRRVALLDSNTYFEAGKHTFTWDGRNDYGLRVAAGLYICKIMSGEKSYTLKMTCAAK